MKTEKNNKSPKKERISKAKVYNIPLELEVKEMTNYIKPYTYLGKGVLDNGEKIEFGYCLDGDPVFYVGSRRFHIKANRLAEVIERIILENPKYLLKPL